MEWKWTMESTEPHTSVNLQSVLGQGAILQVLPALISGGVERGTIDMAIAMKEAGIRNIVASNGGAMVRELERAGIPHIQMPLHSKSPVTMFNNIGRLKKLIKNENIALVHARSRAPAWSALAASKAMKIPFVTTCHAPYKSKGALKRFYNSVMGKGDHVIVISQFVARHMQAVHGVPLEKMSIVYRGIDMEAFHPEAVRPSRMITLSNKWRLPEDAYVILLPARMTEWKGQDILLEALAMLRRPDVCAVMVGSSHGHETYQNRLTERIKQLNIGEQVRLVGNCDDMPAAYLLADIVVSTSREPEGFGRIVVEAQAMGRPVIITNIGATPELVESSVTGWIIPPQDPAALASALEELLDLDSARRAYLAEVSRVFVMDRFDKHTMCKATMQIYAKCIQSV